MTQKNQKQGDRKSDLVCPCCERELVWKGSIMEGKMICTTSWCVKNDEHQAEAKLYPTLGAAAGVTISQGYIDKINGGSGG